MTDTKPDAAPDAVPDEEERRARRGLLRSPADLQRVGKDPDYRFSLANERTFLAWIRTSLALLAGGVAVVQLVPSFSVPGGRHVLGIPLVLMSIMIAVNSYRRWANNELALRLQRPLPPSQLPRLIGAGVALVSLAALAFVVAENWR